MTDRITAGVLYLMLGGFAFAALGLLLPWPFSWDALSAVPGAKAFVIVLSCLGVVSIGLALIFLVRRHPTAKLPLLPLIVAGVALPVVALGWNFLAPLFWIPPLFFVWRASKISQT
jgi:hypothetical protein